MYMCMCMSFSTDIFYASFCLQLKKGEEGLLCTACGKPMINVKVAKKHVQTKAHLHKQKVRTQYMYMFALTAIHVNVPVF